MQVYKQKVKHLLYEHQNNVAKLKADAEVSLKQQQDLFTRQASQEGGCGKALPIRRKGYGERSKRG